MPTWGLLRAGIAALALGAAQLGAAAPVYDNGAPDQVYGTQMSDAVVAEDFVLAAEAAITNLRFWSIQSAPADYLGSVYWAIYSDAAGTPGGLLFGGITVPTTAVATGNSTGFGYAEYVFDADVLDFALGAGTYWLGLHNGPATSIDATEMLWSTTASVVGSESMYFDATSGWLGGGTHLAFALDGTFVGNPPPPPPTGAPEPGTLALVGLAVMAARVAHRKA
ncbi:MAG: PEP-CTERM sorting domain-containing protein [Rhizobacter sp.]